MIKLVAISDTHNRHKEITIPECDVLIHCGDYSYKGHDEEIEKFYTWFNDQPARYLISIQGNHELGYEKDPAKANRIIKKVCGRVNLLNDSGCTIEGVNYWGSPVTPWFYDWAYNRARNDAEMLHRHVGLIKPHWDLIPKSTDVLITHGPPYDILDLCPDGRIVGCEDLLDAVKRVKPDLHFFGHIHHSYGEKHVDGTSFYNVATCDEKYMATNKPVVVEYLTY